MNAHTISAIVPTIGRPESLSVLLDSLALQSVPPAEVIVADGSIDGEIGRVIGDPAWAARGLRIKHISIRPPNAVRQRIHAIAQSRGEYLLLLDDDVVLEPDCIERMLAAVSAAPGVVAAVANFSNQTWPEPTLAWRWYMRLVLGMAEGSWQGRVVGPLLRFGYNPVPDVAAPMGWFGAGNTLLRRSAYDRAGGFSDFFLRRSTINEDVDLGLKVNKVGNIVLCPDARMAHRHAPGGRMTPGAAAEDDLYNRFCILRRTQRKTAVQAFALVSVFLAVETLSNFIGCLRRGRMDGFGARLIGRLSAMTRIVGLVPSGHADT